MIEQAEKAEATRLPGYTHLQQAQPVLLSHHLLAHAWALSRDFDRIIETRSRTDVSPLGAGALAGSSLPIDPIMTTETLGFSETFKNSLDAVSDRDFVAEAVFVNALLAVHLSRIGEELVLWSSEEFGFVDIDDAYTTGSSMLPQKKNPDIAELARAKTGRIVGHLSGLLTVLKGLPLAYNKDLQEDKEPLFDSFDTNTLVLTALTGIFDSVAFNKERMAQAADKPFSVAIDLAEYLVHKGMPFREAHTLIGGLVKASIEDQKDFKKVVLENENFEPEIEDFFKPETAINRQITPGSTGLDAVEVQKEQIAARAGNRKVVGVNYLAPATGIQPRGKLVKQRVDLPQLQRVLRGKAGERRAELVGGHSVAEILDLLLVAVQRHGVLGGGGAEVEELLGVGVVERHQLA